MADIMEVPYLEITAAALIPAVLFYIAVFATVHLEAVKTGLKPLDSLEVPDVSQSLLRSGDQPLPVSLEIPDAVLTGSRYDVDVIFEQPLGQAIVAGGLIPLTPQEVVEQARPNLRLEPMGGGGLFKTVQAPQTPGSQFWAAMLVHPDGVVTMTKRVRVVSSKQDFGELQFIDEPQEITIPVRNSGQENELTVSAVITGGENFTLVSAPAVVPPGGSGDIILLLDRKGDIGQFTAS